jgi:hypothetical protein
MEEPSSLCEDVANPIFSEDDGQLLFDFYQDCYGFKVCNLIHRWKRIKNIAERDFLKREVNLGKYVRIETSGKLEKSRGEAYSAEGRLCGILENHFIIDCRDDSLSQHGEEPWYGDEDVTYIDKKSVDMFYERESMPFYDIWNTHLLRNFYEDVFSGIKGHDGKWIREPAWRGFR